MKIAGKTPAFGWVLVIGFLVSWTSSLVAVYFLVPALHRLLPVPIFAVAGASFLLGFSAALGLLVLRPLARERAARGTKVDLSDLRLFGPN